MGLLSKLIKHTIRLPVSILKDVATLGGAITDEESALKEQFEEFQEDMDED